MEARACGVDIIEFRAFLTLEARELRRALERKNVLNSDSITFIFRWKQLTVIPHDELDASQGPPS